MDDEKRKAAAIALARELYELMPGAEPITIDGEWYWPAIMATKHYNFCRLIAERIVDANTRIFK